MIYLCVCICVCALIYIYICMYIVCDAWNSCTGALSNYSSLQVPLKSCSIAGKNLWRSTLGKLLMSGSFWFAGQSLATMQDRKHCTVAERSNNLFTPGLQPIGCTIANGQTMFGTQPRDLKIPRWIIIFHNCPKYTKIYQNIPC